MNCCSEYQAVSARLQSQTEDDRMRDGMQFLIDEVKGIIELRQGILHVRLHQGMNIEEEEVLGAMTAVNRLCGGRRYPMLVDMAEPAAVSGKALKVFAVSCPASHVALVGSSPVDQVMVTFFLSRHSPPFPAMFFTSSQEALAWLQDPEP